MTVKEPGARDEERIGETVAGPIGEAGVPREQLPLDVRVEFWLETYPWFPAFSAGVGAFALGYVGLFAAVLLAPVALPAGDQPIRIGFLFYNAHNVLVTGTTTALPDAIPLTLNYLPLVDQPMLYRLFPALVITAVSGLFTFLRVPLRRGTGAAVATGAAVGTGYVLLALAGTFVFSLQMDNVLYQPARVGTMLYVLGYGLVFGVFGSLSGQVAMAATLRG